jgi:tetraacyldisaccharide 4'-kinase
VNPLSAIFGAAVAVRNALYDCGVFKARRLARPVVSVGNISVGGSGKTPFVIALGELLKKRGIAFDVLSRGYRRQSKAIAVVDPQGAPEQFGDEPLLIARKLEVPVIVGADRYQAGLVAEQKFPSQLHILDDGFQHRRLHRDFDIVMLPASDVRDKLLPVGRLREPLSALRRADAVVVDSQETEGTVRQSQPAEATIWRACRELFVNQAAGKALAFCGIARARQFFAQLEEARVVLGDTLAFPDHHRYAQAEIERLLQRKAACGADFFVATEKDQINLGPLAERLQPLEIAHLNMRLEDPDAALDHLLLTLEQRCGCRF